MAIGNIGNRRPALRQPGNWWRYSIPLAAGLFLGFGALLVVYTFVRPLAVLVLSVTVADALKPLASWLSRRMRRVVAVSLIYTTLLAAAGVFGWLIAPQVAAEADEIARRAPELIQNAESQMESWLRVIPDSAASRFSQTLGAWMERLLSFPLSVLSTLVTMLLMIFLSFYWLLAVPQIDEFICSLFSPERRAEVDEVQQKMSCAMGGYIRGVTLNALATGGMLWIALEIAGVHYAFALAALTAAGEFFPYIGPVVTAIPGILTALLQSPKLALWTALIYLAVQQVESHLLAPNIMRKQTSVPQPLVIITLFAGFAVGGLLGAVVSIPVAGAAKVLVQSVLAPRIRDLTDGQGSPRRPAA